MAGETQITLPAVDVAVRSDPGRDPSKQVNEDACGWRETRFGVLAVVCDGMGGHVGGREASTAAVETIFEAFERAPAGAAARDVLRDAIRLANARVRGLVINEPTGGRPGSTAVTILVHAGGTEVAHVGDSRAYLVHQGQIFQITRDHSMVQEMVQAKILTPAQAASHPEANKITRALGIDDDIDVELRRQPIGHVMGDAFILCSDGLSDLVDPKEMLEIVSGDPPLQAAGKLVDLANARGGHDNITVIIVRPRVSAPSVAMLPIADTVAEPPVTVRPNATPHPMMPAPTLLIEPTVVEEPAPRPRPKSALPIALLGAGVVLLAALAIVFARLNAEKRARETLAPTATSALTASPPATTTATPLSRAPVELAPVAPPDPGEVDAAGVTPLDPPIIPTPTPTPNARRPHSP